MRHGLIDECRFYVHPMIGRGKPPFRQQTPRSISSSPRLGPSAMELSSFATCALTHSVRNRWLPRPSQHQKPRRECRSLMGNSGMGRGCFPMCRHGPPRQAGVVRSEPN
jgi:hypothetical protein